MTLIRHLGAKTALERVDQSVIDFVVSAERDEEVRRRYRSSRRDQLESFMAGEYAEMDTELERQNARALLLVRPVLAEALRSLKRELETNFRRPTVTKKDGASADQHAHDEV